MANATSSSGAQSAVKSPQQRRRSKRPAGVPIAMIAVIVVVALFFGGLAGYAIGVRSNGYRKQYEAAQEKITTLENQMALIGFSSDFSDANSWTFDDTDSTDEMNDLSGATPASDAFWSEAGGITDALADDATPVVVAEFDGGQLMSNEIADAYNDAMGMLMLNFGDADSDASTVLNRVLEEELTKKVLHKKAEEMGLTELTSADLAAIETSAQAEFADHRAFYSNSVNTDGMTQTDANAAIDKYLSDQVGITLDGLIEQRKEEYWQDKLRDYIGASITVSDEEIQTEYDTLLSEQTASFSSNPDDYEYASILGETIVYNPEGYRYVKHILLAFPDADTKNDAQALINTIAALDPESQMAQIEEAQTQLDALYADLDKQAEDLIAQLNNGADFDSLVAQYGQDDAMKYEPTKSQGYRISANSKQWESAFIEGAMMLETPGQISVPVHTSSGVHIIRYESDVPAGAIPLADVRDAIVAQLRDEKVDDAYDEQAAKWLAESNPRYYPERLQ